MRPLTLDFESDVERRRDRCSMCVAALTATEFLPVVTKTGLCCWRACGSEENRAAR